MKQENVIRWLIVAVMVLCLMALVPSPAMMESGWEAVCQEI